MASLLDPPTQPSALPSPPTSPTSPRTITTRIRIKASRRPNSICYASPGSESHAERTRSMSPSLSRVVTTDPDTPGSEITRTVALASASAAASKRRQSSITYYTPSSPAPWSPRPQPNGTLSSGVDSPRDVEPVVANGKENMSKRSSLVLGSRSPSTRESVSSSDAPGAREREPLTLVEKHADLLHFIAQKERKCLELRDQLAVHEKELAELKRKWGSIVSRGHDPLPNPTSSGLGGVALDGLKEGVRMIAAGFSDLGGVIQELESSGNDPSKYKSLTDAPRENSTSNPCAKRTGSEHLSMSSMSSIQESAHSSDHVRHDGEGETTTVATAPSLSRAGSLGSRVQKRASRVIAKELTMPTSASISPPAQSPKSANLDVGMSLILAPSPTLVPALMGAASAASSTPTPKSPVMGSTHLPAPIAAVPMSSWMDSMGKKLSELQKGQTFSKSQKRASVLLAGVSSTLSAALLPGPTATTPAPAPTSISTLTVLSSTTSPVSTKASLTTRPPKPESEADPRPYPSYKSMTDWLDDDEEQTVHAGGVLVLDSKGQPRGTTDVPVVVGRGEEAAASSFDDDWNW